MHGGGFPPRRHSQRRPPPCPLPRSSTAVAAAAACACAHSPHPSYLNLSALLPTSGRGACRSRRTTDGSPLRRVKFALPQLHLLACLPDLRRASLAGVSIGTCTRSTTELSMTTDRARLPAARARAPPQVDALSEGAAPAGLGPDALQQLQDGLQADAQAVVALALAARQEREPRYRLPRVVNLSLVLCDDGYIRGLNQVHASCPRTPVTVWGRGPGMGACYQRGRRDGRGERWAAATAAAAGVVDDVFAPAPRHAGAPRQGLGHGRPVLRDAGR